MIQIPLTPDEQKYASEHYGLVGAYLSRKKLDESEYFDVVIFGYLRAVRQYLDKPKLMKYKFSTIAWRKMNDCLYEYYRYLKRPKRNAHVVSLDAAVGSNGALTLHDVTAGPDPGMMDFETEQLFLELASKLSKRQLHAVKMKAAGYGVRETAKRQRIKVKEIKPLLERAGNVVLAICGR